MSIFKVTLIFKINYKVEYGKSIFIIGNTKSLGEWNVSNGIKMKWNEVKINTI